MTARVVLPDASLEVRHLRAGWYQLGEDHDIDLEVVSDDELPSIELFTNTASRLSVSLDGGSTFTAVGVYPAGGVDLGSFAAGERKEITVRLNIALATDTIWELLDLELGLGTGGPYGMAAMSPRFGDAEDRFGGPTVGGHVDSRIGAEGDRFGDAGDRLGG